MTRDDRPRWFDGLVRKAVSQRRVLVSGDAAVTVALLECGHEKARSTSGGHNNRGFYFVCDQCAPDRYGHGGAA